MKKRWSSQSGRRALTSGFALLLVMGLSSCGILEAEIAEFGVVKNVGVGTACWVIDTSEATYLPTLLPVNLREEGLEVQFEASSRGDLNSACPGAIIDLIWIEAVPPGDG